MEINNIKEIKATNKAEIHPSAQVDFKANLDAGVVIGAGAVIGPDVSIGKNTFVGPNVVLEGNLSIGCFNKIFPGACLGLEPQDLKYQGASTEVVIGDNNTIRECVTINRATNEGERTIIGDNSLLMAYTHIGHNCEIGNNVVISNGVQVAGHVVVEDRAVIGGLLGIHQFVQIGFMAMIGGMTRVDRDVPPFSLAEGHPGRLRGLNKVGIRRSGLDQNSPEEFRQLVKVWKLLCKSQHTYSNALQMANQEKLMNSSKRLCDFLEASLSKGRRGPMPSNMTNL